MSSYAYDRLIFNFYNVWHNPPNFYEFMSQQFNVISSLKIFFNSLNKVELFKSFVALSNTDKPKTSFYIGAKSIHRL